MKHPKTCPRCKGTELRIYGQAPVVFTFDDGKEVQADPDLAEAYFEDEHPAKCDACGWEGEVQETYQ